MGYTQDKTGGIVEKRKREKTGLMFWEEDQYCRVESEDGCQEISCSTVYSCT